MKFIVLVAALLAITSATMFEEEELLPAKVCKKYIPKAAAWIKAADANKNGVIHKVEAWNYFRKTHLAPKWNAWLKKHGAKLSAAQKKAYWKKRRAFMKAHRAKFMAWWGRWY